MKKRSKYDTAQDIIHNRSRSNPRVAKLIARAFIEYFKATEPNFDRVLFKSVMKKREDGSQAVKTSVTAAFDSLSRDNQVNDWLNKK